MSSHSTQNSSEKLKNILFLNYWYRLFPHTKIVVIICSYKYAGYVPGCGDGGGESSDGRAASASPRVEEPPPIPPAGSAESASLPIPADVSPTADSWEVEADDALLTPEDGNDGDEEESEQQVPIYYLIIQNKCRDNFILRTIYMFHFCINIAKWLVLMNGWIVY